MDFARTVHHLAYRHVVTRQFGLWDETLQDRFFDRGWSTAKIEILLVDGEPCGYTGIEDRPGDVYLRELVIQPEYQGRGIGTTILRQVMARAQGRGVPVRLQVLQQNRAQDLYRRVGFREVGRTETHVLMEWRQTP
jgi:ribosomal protein S18 acetylase RimI-like enzyme